MLKSSFVFAIKGFEDWGGSKRVKKIQNDG